MSPKRKLGSQSPTNMSPKKKKTRVVLAPKLHQWTAKGFEQLVYTPPACSLPSPFAANLQIDLHIRGTIKQFGLALQNTFEPTFNNPQKEGVRENILSFCKDERITWLDPLQPQVLETGAGVHLYVHSLSKYTGTVADVTRTQGEDEETGLIRFKRVFSEYAVQWFAFVQKETQLVVNGQKYPSTRDFVIGPFPSFSILEYHDRVVFLFLSPEGLDYIPGKLDTQQTIDRIVGKFKKEQDSKSKDKEAAASTEGGTIDSSITVRIEPEIQPEDSDSYAYFRLRMAEWTLLQQRSGVTLREPIRKSDADRRGAWLVDSSVWRAIASVTTAIGVEHDVDFAMIDEEGYRRAREFGGNYRDLVTTGRNGDLFLPYNTTEGDGSHWLLVHVKYVNDAPEIHTYDSLNIDPAKHVWDPLKSHGYSGDQIRSIRRTVVQTGLYDDPMFMTDDLDNIPITHHPVNKQPDGWECGYFTVLYAWAIALGMSPGQTEHTAASRDRVDELIEMINLATAGFMDSATIQAFMRCVGFLDPAHNIIAADRHFTRTVPFLTKTSVNRYILQRREIDKNPVSATRRIDLNTMRILLDSANPGALELDRMSPDDILLLFDKWLKERNLVDPTTPPSPTSPQTIRLTFGLAHSMGPAEWAVVSNIPDDNRILRQIWGIYHQVLKKKGYLGQARADRAKDLAGEESSSQEAVTDPNYPYGNPRLIALNRLGMLPTTHTLTPNDKAILEATWM